jgi:AraC-like DNA-binding protein/mannose-6-phosphate isomerase-like protein (cupin superfamily)
MTWGDRSLNEKDIFGRHFEFCNQFFQEPKRYGAFNLMQMGELCCERGYEIEPHMQVCYEISCIISGEGTFFVNGQECPVREGDIFINQKGELHAIKASQQNSLRFFYIGFEFNSRYAEGSMAAVMDFFSNPIKKRLEHDKLDISTHFLKVLNEFYKPAAFSDEMIERYITQILILTYRTYYTIDALKAPQYKNVNVVGGTVYSVVKFIDINILDIESIGSIANNLGYNHAYLSHLFHNKTGMTLQSYVSYKKIEKSLELMELGRLNITQIALMLNYDTVQSFSKAFKRTLGFSPANCQKRLESDKCHCSDNSRIAKQ